MWERNTVGLEAGAPAEHGEYLCSDLSIFIDSAHQENHALFMQFTMLYYRSIFGGLPRLQEAHAHVSDFRSKSSFFSAMHSSSVELAWSGGASAGKLYYAFVVI